MTDTCSTKDIPTDGYRDDLIYASQPPAGRSLRAEARRRRHHDKLIRRAAIMALIVACAMIVAIGSVLLATGRS